jgi:hypothetical protein
MELRWSQPLAELVSTDTDALLARLCEEGNVSGANTGGVGAHTRGWAQLTLSCCLVPGTTKRPQLKVNTSDRCPTVRHAIVELANVQLAAHRCPEPLDPKPAPPVQGPRSSRAQTMGMDERAPPSGDKEPMRQQKTATLVDFFDEFEQLPAPKFVEHRRILSELKRGSQQLYERLAPSTIVLDVDWSENCALVGQREIQSEYWTTKQLLALAYRC